MTRTQEDLAKIFRALGAEDPEGWARSQAKEGIPQLHRFLFLKKAWDRIVDEQDDGWIEGEIEAAKQDPDAPFSGDGLALERILAAGVARSDVVDLVRGAQAKLLFNLCYLLEDEMLNDEEEALLGNIGWALVATDDAFEPTSERVDGLYESVLETDPTGREMRPRPRS